MGAARCKKGSGFPRKCVCLQRALNSNLNRCCCCSCCGYLWSCMSTGQTDSKTDSQWNSQTESQSGIHSMAFPPTVKALHSGICLEREWYVQASEESTDGGWSTEFNHQFCILLLCKCSRFSFVWKVCPLALERQNFPSSASTYA